MRRRALLLPLAVMLPVVPARAPRAGYTLMVRVTDARDGRPLQNAEVAERESGARRLTDAQGVARLALDERATAQVRVRQLGFQPADRAVPHRAGAAADSVDVALVRAPVALPATVARGRSSCATGVDSASSALSLRALEQLRFAAEQYDRFREEYPATLRIERRTVVVGKPGRPSRPYEDARDVDEREWDARYRRGEVMRRTRSGGFDASILFLSTLADTAFWEAHCLLVRQVEERDGRRVIPLEFSPAPELRTADWSGTAWLDSATSELRRVEFALANIDDRADIRRLEGYITFTYPSPFIARPDSIMAGWWRTAPDDGASWGIPQVVQLLHVAGVRYTGRTPDARAP